MLVACIFRIILQLSRFVLTFEDHETQYFFLFCSFYMVFTHMERQWTGVVLSTVISPVSLDP